MQTSELRFPDLDFAVEDLPNPPEVLAELREKEPVSRIFFAGKPIWLVNDYATVLNPISTDDVMSAPLACDIHFLTTMGRVLPTMTGKLHRLNRGVVSRVFFSAKMRGIRGWPIRGRGEKTSGCAERVRARVSCR